MTLYDLVIIINIIIIIYIIIIIINGQSNTKFWLANFLYFVLNNK